MCDSDAATSVQFKTCKPESSKTAVVQTKALRRLWQNMVGAPAPEAVSPSTSGQL